MDAKRSLACKWLTKARRDLFSTKRLARGSEPYLDTAFYTESGHKLRVKVWKKQTLVKLKT